MGFTPLLLAGGQGTRLWPLSRQSLPKQLLPLTGGDWTLLQNTLRRLSGLQQTAPLVLCSQEHRFLVAEQLRALNIQNPGILLEPTGRGTALAVAVGAMHLMREQGGGILLVLSADHAVQHAQPLLDAIRLGEAAARAGHLVTFGITPDSPESAYGYIKKGRQTAAGAFAIDSFVEKPDPSSAEALLAAGDCFWNSGIFMFDAAVCLAELAGHEPEIHAAAEASLAGAERDLDFLRLDAEAFQRSPALPVDVALMEKTDRGVVIPLDGTGWKDLGSWEALMETQSPDKEGNVLLGDVLAVDTRDSLIYSSGRLVAALGLGQLVVVETDDALLVAKRSEVQRVRELVAELSAAGRSEAGLHRRVYRPWGWYETILQLEGFLVKRLRVNPGECLSLQLHEHRSEHWVFVRGQGRVTLGETTEVLSVNQSILVPALMPHQLENLWEEPLEIIEVQTGDYIGEDDIVRISDKYGRADEKLRPGRES